MRKFRLGKAVKTHGLKGEVKIYPYTDDLDRFSQIACFYFGDCADAYFVERVKQQNNMVILKIKGIDRIEDAEPHIGSILYIDEQNLRALEEGEFMIADLVGLEAVTTDGALIGRVKEVLQYAANDIYVVRAESGKEYLIPATKEIVPEISLEEGKMWIVPIKGLLE